MHQRNKYIIICILGTYIKLLALFVILVNRKDLVAILPTSDYSPTICTPIVDVDENAPTAPPSLVTCSWQCWLSYDEQ